jgi:aryl-alcohol dehydrogenase-like predicted oxidoreductase
MPTALRSDGARLAGSARQNFLDDQGLYPDLHFAKRDVIEALDEAKRQGKVRFVGFTGHKNAAIHLKMRAHDYPFDTVQMPLNCF